MKKIKDFNSFNDVQSQNYLAQSTPKGKLFANRFDESKNIYKLLLCLSQFIKVITGQLFTLAKNRDIDQVDELLTEWEDSVKLSERFPVRDTIVNRRIALKKLISKYPIYNLRPATDDDTTIEKYIEDVLGISVEITNYADTSTSSSFPIPFPIVFGIPYVQRQLLLRVLVDTGASPINNAFPIPFPVSFFEPVVPDATQELLSKALKDTVPMFQNWRFEVLF